MNRGLLGGLATSVLVDYYLRIVHFDRRMPVNIDLGPLHIYRSARAVLFTCVTIAVLVIGAIADLLSRVHRHR
jgi:phosphatidate cytidylyltransferase